ncbi:MAG: SMI1/KNR4 family protein [Xanthomonadales bacterium]|nr:SMI1/KNR4 family protein [Xanthomonadales bacterium]
MRAFLQFWSDQIVLRLERARFPADRIQQQILQRKSILLPPATRSELDELQGRLETELPPSVLEFLSVTNGVSAIIDYADAPLDFFPCSQIGWLHEQAPGLVRIWTEEPDWPGDSLYFRYGEDQDVIYIRTDYLKRMITLGPVVDGGVFLLNPQVRLADGELEAWDFSVKHPGAIRYRSLPPLLEKYCTDSCWNLDYWSATHEFT